MESTPDLTPEFFVPVHGRRFRQVVLKMDDDAVALGQLERRTRHGSVVREDVGWDTGLQR